ncbi:hypothetical protein STIAU_3312 [Stigmatella aurantiaca DW4/3-1]|uniref:DUF2380 domain-containing protein n=3 Tax=Stigmatella aurantiaca TaxID=41 RepID=Q099N6_STIAD|nr:hypothetical protein STIAU_3312 [Stigmatella aurantiaca DW4/3-1]
MGSRDGSSHGGGAPALQKRGQVRRLEQGKRGGGFRALRAGVRVTSNALVGTGGRMKLAVALGCVAALLTGCTAGAGRTEVRDEAVSHYNQTARLAGRTFSSQKTALPTASGPERQRVTQMQQALLGAIDDVKRSTGGIAASLRQFSTGRGGLGNRANGAFNRSIGYGTQQLQWIHGALGAAATLAGAASEAEDLDMELGILRMGGPRLQAAMSGAALLAAWVDFLNLAEVMLRQCPLYSAERLVADVNRVQKRLEPSMRALASLDPGHVEAAAAAMPELMCQLTREFQSIRDAARVATERGGQIMAAAQAMEMLTLVSGLKMSLSRLPPAAPALLGVGLVMGSNGVMMGSQLIVTTEWVERMRRLVQAGILSVTAVSAAVRIQAGQVMMAQTRQDLPQGVRDALGDGPEVRAMHETGKAGAGMPERPRHHVLPAEFREWFEKRGFTGPMSIDQFCVELEMAHHQAIHGGGNWRLGRTWPKEWNQMIMSVLRDAETAAGRRLTRDQILKIVARYMRNYDIPMSFTSGRTR